ncbi:MAG: hypothetical protein OFPI_42990 [Osedax symbiont Rs2]|nr:MAG: hypothetical protein OFPI_42990 [Osedax symbiont Rs2]
MKIDQQIKEIDQKILVARLVDTPGTVIFLLAIYAKFYTNGDAFVAVLNNAKVVNSMFVLGVVLMVWGGLKIFKLRREKNRILKGL